MGLAALTERLWEESGKDVELCFELLIQNKGMPHDWQTRHYYSEWISCNKFIDNEEYRFLFKLQHIEHWLKTAEFEKLCNDYRK